MCGAHFDGRGQFVHEALFYRDGQRAIDAASQFVREGIVRGQPALAALPAATLDALRGELRGHEQWLESQDIEPLGVNPGRLLPWIADWLGRQPSGARVVGEPLWRNRTGAERTELVRHEALVNLALNGARAKLLCLYHEPSLDTRTRHGVQRTHRVLRGPAGARGRSPAYVDPRTALRDTEALAPPLDPVQELEVTPDLHRLRRRLAASPLARGLPAERKQDFVLAVNEAATNALKYDCPPRALRLWRSEGCVVCEVAARGVIADPLAGRRSPRPTATRGRGLWLVNQLCDLVELRSHDSRATVRMHMRCS
jgi:anti-sigma regulatory factor (Ser/Thr protein kinase)